MGGDETRCADELIEPLSNSRNEPSATSADAGTAFDRTLKPRCFV